MCDNLRGMHVLGFGLLEVMTILIVTAAALTPAELERLVRVAVEAVRKRRS